jgi:uncharacterized membrane protein YbaN (DUF454 family)
MPALLDPVHQGRRIVRFAWLTLGCLFVVMGIIGALLPLMPTTIFLILAAGCFARSSPRMESWLLGHSRFGPTLRAWRRDKAIGRKAKATACGGIVTGYGFFVLTVHPSVKAAAIVALIMGACGIYILKRTTAKS